MNRNATILSNVTTTISANTTTSNDITSYLGNQFSNVVSGVASQLTCLFKCCSKEDQSAFINDDVKSNTANQPSGRKQRVYKVAVVAVTVGLYAWQMKMLGFQAKEKDLIRDKMLQE